MSGFTPIAVLVSPKSLLETRQQLSKARQDAVDTLLAGDGDGNRKESLETSNTAIMSNGR